MHLSYLAKTRTANDQTRSLVEKSTMALDIIAALHDWKLATSSTIEETAVNIRNKVSRGKFMAALFMLPCLRALGVDTLRPEDG